MEVGYLIGMYYYWIKGTPEQKQLAVESIAAHIRYGKANSWNMCGENGALDTTIKISRCIMSTNLKATIYELNHLMGGAKNAAQSVAQVWDPSCTGFRCHLTVVHWLLRGSMQDGINDLQKNFLTAKAEKNKANALYVMASRYFTDGFYNDAYINLEDPNFFPAEHLPTTDDRCVDYLWQRDQYRTQKYTADEEGCIEFIEAAADHRVLSECELKPGKEYSRWASNGDYLPCSEKDEAHSATDFRFVWATINGALRPNTK